MKLIFGRESVVHQAKGIGNTLDETGVGHVGGVKTKGELHTIVYSMIVLVLFGLTVAVYVKPSLLPLAALSNAYSSINDRVPETPKKKQEANPHFEISSKAEEKSLPVDDVEDIPEVVRTLSALNKSKDDELVVTQKDIDKAVKEVVSEKISKEEATNKPVHRNQYYVIKLWSGGEIRTNNIKISETDVVFRDAKGYEVSIARSEITNVKRYTH